MKFLILLAVAAVLGSVHCDQECFRAVFKECVREPVPQERMTLCDEFKYEIECVYQKAFDCHMPFRLKALNLKASIDAVCELKEDFVKNKACYVRAVNDSVCVAPMKEAMTDIHTSEDAIRANKKVCNLFDTYATCVKKNVKKNCHDEVLFSFLLEPYRRLSNSLCKELILPADEKDDRPDNFGRLNVYASLAEMIASA